MAYKARTTPPDYTDKRAIAVKTNGVSYGGLNNAMAINKTTGCVYANCTGHVHMRALEVCGNEVENRLCTGNASSYYGYTQDGLERGQTPKLGAIAVWSGGSRGFGHVAFVEALYSNGDFLCSNSNYSGNKFYTMRVAAPSYSPWVGYVLLGFIYLPWETETKYYGTPKERDTSKHQVEITSKILRARKRPEMNDEVILGIMNAGIYDVLEIRDMRSEASNGYLWYRIDDELWMATNEGNWSKDLPAENTEELKRQIAELTAENTELKKSLGDISEKCAVYRDALADIGSTIEGIL